MLASKHFGLTTGPEDDWFDTILNADTRLFVDPFMVFQEKTGRWARAHDKIVEHFNRAFLLIAEGNRDPQTIAFKKALALLVFREPRELCLGYTDQGTEGAGSGRRYARAIAEAIADAIGRGLKHPKHFEELGILNKGIGADRISDITATILKAELVAYTQEISAKHKIPCSEHEIFAASFDARRQRWQAPKGSVPTNPNTGGPLLFVPKRFLRELPVLNAYDWWDDYENEQLREDVNYEIMGRVDKDTIVSVARQQPELVRQWIQRRENDPAESYDFERDPQGVWRWQAATQEFAERNELRISPPQTLEEFFGVITRIIDAYRLFVEEQGGWQLLWDKDDEKPESAAQLLFRGIAQHYAKANNVVLDPEVNLGRGPVDFKFSNGYTRRLHLEVKKLHNGKFWNGLERQLPSYMKSDDLQHGWLLALQYRSAGTSNARRKELPARTKKLSEETDLNIRFALVDARPKDSASRL